MGLTKPGCLTIAKDSEELSGFLALRYPLDPDLFLLQDPKPLKRWTLNSRSSALCSAGLERVVKLSSLPRIRCKETMTLSGELGNIQVVLSRNSLPV